MHLPTLLLPLLLFLDQTVKLWALEHLSPIPKPLLGDLLYLTLTFNTGAGFGLLQQNAPLLGWLSLLVGVGLLGVLGQRRPRPWGEVLALTLIAAGALGNGIDRLGRGRVVDFLDLGTNIPWVRDFPIFNLADVYLTLGLLLLLLGAARSRRRRW